MNNFFHEIQVLHISYLLKGKDFGKTLDRRGFALGGMYQESLFFFDVIKAVLSNILFLYAHFGYFENHKIQ